MILDLPVNNERRQSPRFVIDLPVDIVKDDGNVLPVTSRNISSNGMQITCDSWVTDEIEPRGIQSHSINHLRFKIVIELQIEKDTKKLYANCRVKSVQRLSQNVYVLSLAFTDFENGTESVLNKYLAQHKQKKILLEGVIGK